MTARRFSGFLSVTLLVLAGCVGHNISSGNFMAREQSQDVEAIQRLAETWRSGWIAGDVDLLLSLYAEEPVLMPQDQPAITGREAIRAVYEAVLKGYDFQSDGVVKEVKVSGDMGYFWSTYTLTAIPKAGGEPTKVTGKSLFILARGARGDWKISRLMDNSDGVPADQEK